MLLCIPYKSQDSKTQNSTEISETWLHHLCLFSWYQDIDSLDVTGATILSDDHIDTIFDCLPEEYDDFITSITSRLDPYTIEDIEAFLLAQKNALRST